MFCFKNKKAKGRVKTVLPGAVKTGGLLKKLVNHPLVTPKK